MKLNPWAAAAVLTMLAFPLQAANEPEAGAIVRKLLRKPSSVPAI